MPDPATLEGFRIPDDHRSACDAALRLALDGGWAERVWERDTTVWTDDADVAVRIAQRLGWLDAPAHFRPVTDDLRAFADGLREAGIDRALVCGMGGSSLAPEVLGLAYPMGAGAIPVGVLDSTDPETVELATPSARDELLHHRRKSGRRSRRSRSCPLLPGHAGHREIGSKDEGDHFVAVSDPDDAVEAIPHSDSFRAVFLNPPDIGGRYSALTYVGLVPAALLGLDLDALLDEAGRMAEACRATDAGNPGIALGTMLGALAGRGRDKLTLVIEPAIEASAAGSSSSSQKAPARTGTASCRSSASRSRVPTRMATTASSCGSRAKRQPTGGPRPTAHSTPSPRSGIPSSTWSSPMGRASAASSSAGSSRPPWPAPRWASTPSTSRT
jgi:hypothetical protein